MVTNRFVPSGPFLPSYNVDKPLQGRRLAITDVHGFYGTFTALLDRIALTKQDQLFLLGDYIDKGKQGKEVLDLIIELIAQGYAVFPLRGNHEEMVLQSHFCDRQKGGLLPPVLSRTKGIRDSGRKLFPKYLHFLQHLPYFFELDEFWLVHAGFDFSKANPFDDFQGMVWTTHTALDPIKLKGKTLVHGHVKKTLDEIWASVRQPAKVIGLDNATVFVSSAEYGNMVCLNLDSFELTVQRNVDKKAR